MKKTNLVLLLALLLLASACGEAGTAVTDDTTAAPDTEPAVETDYLDTIKTDKFSGKTLRILDANDHPDMHVNIPLEEQNGDVTNDALWKRDRLVEDTFGIEIEYTQVGSKGSGAKTGTGQLNQAVLAGDDICDYVISCLLGGALQNSATSGVLMNLLDLEGANLTEPWWSAQMYDTFRLNDAMFFTTGDIATSMYQACSTTFANSRLLDEYKITDDLLGIALDGKWTIDKQIAITKDMNRDLNEDGVISMQDDFIGFYQASGVIVGAGLRTVVLNDAHTALELNFSDEKIINAVDKLKAVALSPANNAGNDGPKIMFKEGRLMFFSHPIEVAMSHFRDMADDYIVLPSPKYNEAQESYISNFSGWVDSFVGVPLTADAEFSGAMMEAMAYIGYRDIRPKVYELVYKQKALRDERSGDVLDLCFNGAYSDFNIIYNFGGSYSVPANAINGTTELVSGLEAARTSAESAIADFVKTWNAD